jgi:ubiquitin carboxyl-terminal hydrolase 8
MKGVCGLANVGNSCYLNAALQIFSQLDELNHYLLTLQNVKNRVESNVTVEWILLYKLFHDNHGTITPNRFIETIKKVSIPLHRDEFSGQEQSDSVEFFEFMLECIHNSLNGIDDSLRVKRRPDNPIDKYLEQLEKTEHSKIQDLFLTCSVNRYVNPESQHVEFDRIEHEYRISLSIPEVPNVSIHDCFIDTFKEELLSGDNAWFDEKENRKKTVVKRSYLCSCSSILVLHLKRWKSNLTKKNFKIETPLRLDVQPYTIYKESCLYELFGIINHEGSIHGGHYYASIQKKGTWFSINDHLIQSLPPEQLIHERNYCLFYRKIK